MAIFATVIIRTTKPNEIERVASTPARAILSAVLLASRVSAGPADRDPLHPQRRLADADRHALAVLAAGADAGVELQSLPTI